MKFAPMERKMTAMMAAMWVSAVVASWADLIQWRSDIDGRFDGVEDGCDR